ncbi:hypothetical protein BT93_A0981 [Corymbia citriodora subsp. variegata]|nr:hypothetical protein BT93_A0981 [Corymbia citriodora subsp. variegata]
MSSFKLLLLLHLMMGLLSISGSDRPVPKATVYVDKSGSGNYSSVQAAIDAVPDDNDQWIQIVIKQGTYNEKVMITSAKQYIFLQGDRDNPTIIEYGDYGSATESATFRLYGDNFIALDINFKVKTNSITSLTHYCGPRARAVHVKFYVQNSYSPVKQTVDDTPVSWAPAAFLAGDKASFYRCSFHGIQDTLGDGKGRHYFTSCNISGAIDFIWGGGQSVYKDCLLETIASTIGRNGYVTAQGREGPNDSSGFVFINGWLTGEGQTYLGRAYRQYSRVLFYKTSMTAVIVPEGWSAWNFEGKENDITYDEVECTGEGANESGRVQWMKNLPSQEVEYLLSNNFVNQDGWLDNQPGYNQIQTTRY